jgi:uncharacterized protein YdbL (DUF1318 family)
MKELAAAVRRSHSGIALFVLCLLAFPLALRAADSLADISKRVAERQAAIESAISGGSAKETSQGLLESSANADQATQDLVQAENRDRRAAFSALAAKYKESPSKIAAQFSQMAGKRSSPQPPPSSGASPGATPAVSPSPQGAPPAVSPTPASVPGATPDQAQKKSGTSIPLKIITRPFSSILADASDSAAIVQSNIPAFTVFYVYNQQPGWYQVGKTKNGGAFGWIKEKDAILWKQNLVMEFTHPANRMPVMFFKEKDDLKRIALENSSARGTEAEALFSQITSKNIPDPFPIAAMEPNRATDSRTTFYMLPITDYEAVQIDGRDGRLLKVAAATKDRKNQSLAASVQPATTSAAAKTALLDVVFVMDCTSSMKPLVDGTMQAIRGLVSKLSSDPDTNSAMNLGFWGYRDSAPDQDFGGSPVKNFTPTLQPAGQFLQTLSGVEVSSNSAGDYAEDVFGGVKAAMTETKWRPNSLRVVILVGDASAHPPGHAQYSSKMGDSQLRAMADEQNVYLASFYIERQSPFAAPDRQVAEGQFRKLAQNRNTTGGKADFCLIQERGGLASFSSMMEGLASKLSSQISDVRKGKFTPSAPSVPASGGGSSTDTGAQMASNMFSGAFVDWLARQKDTAMPPSGDIESWVVDRDLKDPAIQPMEVKVMLQKNELDALAKVLDNIVTAGVRGQVTGQNFFEALQSAAASAVSSPDQIRNARNLAATGLLPDFLSGLPYKSRLMIMDPATWNSMSVDSQSEMLETVQAKRKFYEETLKDASLWQAFNPDDSEDQKVAPIPLEQLP